MKITPDHYNTMLARIKALGPQTIQGHAAMLATQDNYKDFNKRFRWDLFFMAGLSRFACDSLYSYCDDSHIDTALKNIVKEVQGN